MSPVRRHGASSGFTLLEVLVATMVLAIGIIATMKLAFQVSSGLYDAKMQAQAVGLATTRMAQVEVLGPDKDEDKGDFGQDFPDFAWKLKAADTSVARLKLVTLTVTWSEGAKELVFERLVYKP